MWHTSLSASLWLWSVAGGEVLSEKEWLLEITVSPHPPPRLPSPPACGHHLSRKTRGWPGRHLEAIGHSCSLTSCLSVTSGARKAWVDTALFIMLFWEGETDSLTGRFCHVSMSKITTHSSLAVALRSSCLVKRAALWISRRSAELESRKHTPSFS